MRKFLNIRQFGQQAWSIAWMPVAVYVAQMLRQALLPSMSELDILAHYLGGFAIAYGTHNLLCLLPRKLTGWPFTPFTTWIALVFSAVFVGVAWEWYEWLRFHNLHGVYDGVALSQLSWWNDTVHDLLMDTLGAATLASLFAARKR